MKDEDICKLLISRNQHGLSCLLDEYGALIAYIIRNTGLSNPEDITECVSDVLLAVWKRVRKFDSSKSAFKTWLVLVTRGCAIDYLRKNRKYNNIVYLEDAREQVMRKLYSESSALKRLLEPDLIQMLQELPPPDNEIFYRRFILGEKVAEIAETLGLTQENIYKRIDRGKTKLKRLLEKEGYNYG